MGRLFSCRIEGELNFDQPIQFTGDSQPPESRCSSEGEYLLAHFLRSTIRRFRDLVEGLVTAGFSTPFDG